MLTRRRAALRPGCVRARFGSTGDWAGFCLRVTRLGTPDDETVVQRYLEGASAAYCGHMASRHARRGARCVELVAERSYTITTELNHYVGGSGTANDVYLAILGTLGTTPDLSLGRGWGSSETRTSTYNAQDVGDIEGRLIKLRVEGTDNFVARRVTVKSGTVENNYYLSPLDALASGTILGEQLRACAVPPAAVGVVWAPISTRVLFEGGLHADCADPSQVLVGPERHTCGEDGVYPQAHMVRCQTPTSYVNISVSVTTSTTADAQTNAPLYIQFIGHYTSSRLLLTADGYRNGETRVTEFTAVPDVGRVSRIKLLHEVGGHPDGWLFTTISVTVTAEGSTETTTYKASLTDWLDGDDPANPASVMYVCAEPEAPAGISLLCHGTVMDVGAGCTVSCDNGLAVTDGRAHPLPPRAVGLRRDDHVRRQRRLLHGRPGRAALRLLAGLRATVSPARTFQSARRGSTRATSRRRHASSRWVVRVPLPRGLRARPDQRVALRGGRPVRGQRDAAMHGPRRHLHEDGPGQAPVLVPGPHADRRRRAVRQCAPLLGRRLPLPDQGGLAAGDVRGARGHVRLVLPLPRGPSVHTRGVRGHRHVPAAAARAPLPERQLHHDGAGHVQVQQLPVQHPAECGRDGMRPDCAAGLDGRRQRRQ